MSDETLLVGARDGYRVLTLNRPERLNAFNGAQMSALQAALAEAEADPACRAILLTGSGRGFCAGQDLGERRFDADAPPPDLGAGLERGYNRLVRSIAALPKPVVCAVNGVAAGAGANLALACDLVLAARSARFLQAFTRIGLIPDCGGTWALPRLVGAARARALMLLAEPLEAAQAAEWGLIWRVVEDAELMPQAEALCARLATMAPRALALTKQALAASPTNALSQQLDLERDLQREAGRTADYREGVLAFLEKRAAKFTGR